MIARRGAEPPPLHVIVPDGILVDERFSDRATRLQEACGPALALHVRPRELPAAALYERTREVVRGAERHGGWCVVNGRADIARAAGAHAVQLGRHAPPLDALLPYLGPGLRVGASVHGVEEAVRAAALGANYLLLGTIFPTPSHPGRAGAGSGLVRLAVEALGRQAGAPGAEGGASMGEGRASVGGPVPVVAIGGIDEARVAEVRAAGAAGVAVLRAVWEAPDAVKGASALLEAWRSARVARGSA